MKKSGGVYVKLNGNQAVQKVAGSAGVGHTKSVKATVQKVAGSKGVGQSKSQKAVVSPARKKNQAK